MSDAAGMHGVRMHVGRLSTLDLTAENRIHVISFEYLILLADEASLIYGVAGVYMI